MLLLLMVNTTNDGGNATGQIDLLLASSYS